jgi:uncharacterized protein YndB with AHSA1/START domain
VTGPRLDVLAPQDAPVIAFRRAFAAPPRLVFEAWTEPRHLLRWRGPRGFEVVACDVDLRVGGRYRFVHRAPDGSEHVFSGQYREIERPSRLVSTFAYHAAPAVEGLDEVTFEEQAGATLVTGRSTFPSFEARDLYLDGGAEQGLAQCHEHLDELLRTLWPRPQEGKDR